ncbi:RnfH family protein [Piscinibacter sakaiensis]|uniref:RnfH family protein n=1 Tax=Piscinibacter sakaiensis TaxID=1547922 RepID=UPI003AAC7B4B
MVETPLPASGQHREAPIRVEVVYCADRTTIDTTRLELPAGARVDDALRESRIAERFAGAGAAGVGIWGRQVDRSQALRDGDRIEIYRQLLVDPKEARRLRQRRQARARAGRPGPPR